MEGAAWWWVLTLPILSVHCGIDDSNPQTELRKQVSQDPTLILSIANNFIPNSQAIVILLGTVQDPTFFFPPIYNHVSPHVHS